MKTKPTQGAGEVVMIVPDVHLRLEATREILEAWGDSGPAVFLGDFFDDFGDTPERNRDMAIFLRDEVLPNPKYTVLMGNHDLHYHPRCPSEMWCSGFHPEKKKAIGQILGDDEFSRFQWAHAWDGVLFTHAGLHPRMIPPRSTGDARELSEWINQACSRALETRDSSEPLLRAGKMRGGYQPVGGVIWMDAREYQPVEKLRQIFGHTPLRKPMDLDSRPDGSWCIDTNLEHVTVLRGGGEELRIVEVPRINRETLSAAGVKPLSKGVGRREGRGGGGRVEQAEIP